MVQMFEIILLEMLMVYLIEYQIQMQLFDMVLEYFVQLFDVPLLICLVQFLFQLHLNQLILVIDFLFELQLVELSLFDLVLLIMQFELVDLFVFVIHLKLIENQHHKFDNLLRYLQAHTLQSTNRTVKAC